MGRWRRDELDDIDTVAVLRAIDGDRPALTKGERFVVAVELRQRGATYGQIGEHIGVAQRQVYRYLRRAGLTKPRTAVPA